MYKSVVLRNGTRTAVAYLPSRVALIGNVIYFAGEFGWEVVQVGVQLPPRLLPKRMAVR